jgi:membrane-associated phospholipid phosphatase
MNRLERQNVQGEESTLTLRAPAIGGEFPGIRAWVAREAAAVWAECGAFEWVSVGYLAASGVLIAALAENLAHPLKVFAVHSLVAVILFLLIAMERRAGGDASSSKNFSARFWHFWRHWYPHLFFLFCFEELAVLVHLVNSGWQDAKLLAADQWLTGVQPSLWLEQFASPLRNDFMQFAYLTYFTYLLILGGILYYRRDWRGYWSVMTYSAAGYAIGYFIAIFFPIESPWFSMAGAWHAPLHGGPFTAAINLIEHYGRVRGAAFPSEHVAGSIACLWGAWRHRRWLFWIMAPLVFCMCASTVWGRYHYLVDVFAGMITGTLGYLIGSRIMKARGAVAAEIL